MSADEAYERIKGRLDEMVAAGVLSLEAAQSLMCDVVSLRLAAL